MTNTQRCVTSYNCMMYGIYRTYTAWLYKFIIKYNNKTNAINGKWANSFAIITSMQIRVTRNNNRDRSHVASICQNCAYSRQEKKIQKLYIDFRNELWPPWHCDCRFGKCITFRYCHRFAHLTQEWCVCMRVVYALRMLDLAYMMMKMYVFRKMKICVYYSILILRWFNFVLNVIETSPRYRYEIDWIWWCAIVESFANGVCHLLFFIMGVRLWPAVGCRNTIHVFIGCTLLVAPLIVAENIHTHAIERWSACVR